MVTHETIKRTAGALVLILTMTPMLASAQNRQPAPPGARSSLSPPETNPIQAEEFKRGYEAYYRGEFERAATIWTRLANQGHIKSMNNLGTMYTQGKGVDRDYATAVRWYERGATQKDARAAYNLGLAHENGRGVSKDDSTAALWYRQAADRGLVEGMNALAWIQATSPSNQVRDGSQALRWAQAALQLRTSVRNLATMAAAHAELGDFRTAVSTIEQAIALKKNQSGGAGRSTGGRDINGLIREPDSIEESVLAARLEQYRTRQPTRD